MMGIKARLPEKFLWLNEMRLNLGLPEIDISQFPISPSGQVLENKSRWRLDEGKAMQDLDEEFPGYEEDE